MWIRNDKRDRLSTPNIVPEGAEDGILASRVLADLARGPPHLSLRNLRAGYGKMEVLHGINLILGRGQSLCIIGPNGSGKSTVLNTLFGLTNITGGQIEINCRNMIGAPAGIMLSEAKISYVLQASSVFPDMTVEENLLVGGHLLKSRRQARLAVERILDTYPRLADRRMESAGVLSGGERRLLEVSRALITEPDILLLDEPSIGLEPRTIDLVFEMLSHLQRVEGKTIVIVEQNAKKGLEFADLGYVLVSGRVVLADQAARILENPKVSSVFLGGRIPDFL